jgi:Ca-activated chloride channel family protein
MFSGDFNTEQYDHLPENEFRSARSEPLSTFSIDVDRASYSNTRRFLNSGSLPPVDAVRIEEFINYFDYDYPAPKGDQPLSVYNELADCPWNTDHKLLMVGIKAREIRTSDLPPMNLTFLIDVSGSMRHSNKLPLLKNGMRLLVDQMRPTDRVAIVVYAGAAGLVLPSTSGADRQVILDAIENLQAGGSTAGAQGIKLAYDVAVKNYRQNGNNRVILATDGDFNVGVSSDGELVRLIEQKRGSGVFLTVLGFGSGNLKDSRMEKLADKGNGNYAYIDNIQEAKKVLVSEMGATMFTVANDVKIQVEFNPARVSSYKLIGYENRLLKNEDFNNDKKDAGEVGSGHTVTALYELVPAGLEDMAGSVDPLKYQSSELLPGGNELLTLKLRYKYPGSPKSELMTRVVKDKHVKFSNASEDFRFASSVAMFGMILRNSCHKGISDYDKTVEMARAAKGDDDSGYRSEFIRLVELASLLKPM